MNRFTILKGEVMADSTGEPTAPTLVVRELVKHFGPVVALAPTRGVTPS